MVVKNLLLQYSIFSLLLFSLCFNFEELKNNNSYRFTESVCDLTRKILVENQEIENIVIASFDTNFSQGTIDHAIMCLPKNIPLIVTDLIREDDLTPQYGWKTMQTYTVNKFMNVLDVIVPKNSLIIIFTDKLNAVIILMLIS